MSGSNISCESCERIWSVATAFTLHEQQAMESCPCPHCGAYTLTCREPVDAAHDKRRRPVLTFRAA